MDLDQWLADFAAAARKNLPRATCRAWLDKLPGTPKDAVERLRALGLRAVATDNYGNLAVTVTGECV